MVEKCGRKVEVKGIGVGWIARVRFDDRGGALYTVYMDDPNATADGHYIARPWELLWL